MKPCEIGSTKRWTWFGLLALIGMTAVLYLPSLHGNFIWDDDVILIDNPLIQKPHGLWEIWFTSKPLDYVPLTLTSFWFEWRVFGADPFGYHVINVLLHALNAVLLWRVLKCLKVPGAWFAAALFAAHPVCVA